MSDRLLLPGLNFGEQIKTKHHVPQCFLYKNGYRMICRPKTGIGKEPLQPELVDDVHSSENPIMYDPMLVYGSTKKTPIPAFQPHFVIYDKKTLRFSGYFLQNFPDSSTEAQKTRCVNILYYLEDDTITVLEPIVNNSGLTVGFPQGRVTKLVRRSKIPKNSSGMYYTWKDFNLGIDIKFNGIVFHITDCDAYTKNFLLANGIELNDSECFPDNHDSVKNQTAPVQNSKKSSTKAEDKLRKFLDFSGKVLHFDCVLEDPASSDVITFKMFYFLEDDTVSIKELKENQEGRDHFSMLLKRAKLPKNWMEKGVEFPAGDSNESYDTCQEYYCPTDFIIGSTVFVFGRKFVLLDCDQFTRSYYSNVLKVQQPNRQELEKPVHSEIKIKIPDYLGLGTPEDSLSSCYTLIPKAPKKDVITYLVNANKVLRYGCRLDTIYPEDNDRKFVMIYNLSEGKIQIQELPVVNSGRSGGKFLSSQKLTKPDSNRNKPEYYTPKDLYIGALVVVYSHRFIVTSADLYVYKYMMSHPELFSPEIIDNLRMFHLKEGNLKDNVLQSMHKEHQEYILEQENRKAAESESTADSKERLPKPQITEDEVKKSYHETNDSELPCNIEIEEITEIPSDHGVVRFKLDYEK